MNRWEPTQEQLTDWETKGYFVIRNLIPRDTAIELRGDQRHHFETRTGQQDQCGSHGPHGQYSGSTGRPLPQAE